MVNSVNNQTIIICTVINANNQFVINNAINNAIASQNLFFTDELMILIDL
jgi:hypothetical protein